MALETEIPAKSLSLTFIKGMTVLKAFDDTQSPLSLADIARRTGIERAVVRRLVLTLVHLGYVRKDGTRYALTPRILVLAGSFLQSNQFGRAIQPLIEMCAHELGVSVGMAMLDDDSAVYVAQSAQHSARYTYGFTLGSRLPLLQTSMGRMLLAWGDPVWAGSVIASAPLVQHTAASIIDRASIACTIQEARQAGACIVTDEFEAGAVGITVPIGAMGAGKAALGIAEPQTDLPTDRHQAVIDVLRRYAGRITPVLG
ncbi:MAG: helix-turn-helix domain-containing protein [Qingshengfaniella sp.]